MEPTITMSRQYLGYSLYEMCAAIGLDLISFTDQDEITVFDPQKDAAEKINLHQLVSRVVVALAQAKDEIEDTLTLGNALVVRAAECLQSHEEPLGVPPWQDAPYWARYMVPVVYSNGAVWWYAYEAKPTRTPDGTYDHANGRWGKVRGCDNIKHLSVLHKRPEPAVVPVA
jgi:hypothetical protein